jgi:hypothetical protein
MVAKPGLKLYSYKLHICDYNATHSQSRLLPYAKRSQDDFGSRAGIKMLDCMIFNFEV